jgi:tetratricopeptide (TPR) repeat protein
MKKIILLLMLAISFSFTFAQKTDKSSGGDKSDFKSAHEAIKSSLRDSTSKKQAVKIQEKVVFGANAKANVRLAKDKALQDKPDFKSAREAIKLALKDSVASTQAETWYVAGLIGNKQSEAELTKCYLKQPYDTLTKGKAMLESYDYFIQTIKLDNLPDAKGKAHPRYSNEIKTILKDYYQVQPNLINYGIFAFGKNDFESSFKTFEAYLAIPKIPIMKNEIKPDTIYDLVKLYAGMSASKANLHDKAIQFYTELKNVKNIKTEAYSRLSNEYLIIKDSANYLKTIKEAIEVIPTEPLFMQNLINYFIRNNKTQDAIQYLNTAIEREPSNVQYYYVKGQLYLQLENFVEANKALNKAIEVDPTHSGAYAELGRSYYNNAFKQSKEAEKIKDLVQFKKEDARIDEVFKLAIPYYKKALELKPTELDYMDPLKKLYYKLQMNAEYDDIVKRMKAVK